MKTGLQYQRKQIFALRLLFNRIFIFQNKIEYNPQCRRDICVEFSYPIKLFYICESEVAQSCPNLCYPMDDSLPGSPIPGIFQARTLVWVAISFSSAWKWKVKVKSLSRVWHLATPWTAAYQTPLTMGFSRQEY